MKALIRSFAALLMLCMLFAFCACSKGADSNLDLNGNKVIKGTDFHYTLDEGCRETFNLRFLVTDANNSEHDSAGIYMMDMDSGKVYDDTFLDWDLMIQDGTWNLENRNSALMIFFQTYVDNMNSDIIWSETAEMQHLSTKELKHLGDAFSFDDVWDGKSADTPATELADHEITAAAGIDMEFVYEQASLLNIQLNEAIRYTATLEEGCGAELDLLFFQSTEFDGENKAETIGSPGFYMLDLSTDTWYDSSFQNWDIMVNGTNMNLDTKELAMMWAFQLFSEHLEDVLPCRVVQKISLDAAEIEAVNQKVLFDQLTRKKQLYPYATVDEEGRKLSDAELLALNGRPAGFIKSAISTVPDAIAYLDMRYPELWMGLSVHNGVDLQQRWLRAAQEILYFNEENIASRSCVVNCLTYLLDDDYEIESLIAFWPDPEVLNESGPEKAINMIKTTGGYLFFDPVVWMQGDAMSRYGSVLPQMKCSSMAEYIENIRQDPALGTTIKFIFKNTGGVRMNYQHLFNPDYTIQTDSSDIEMVYFSVDAKEAGDQVKPENIDRYMISSILGGVTLTAEEAYALVDEQPEVVQEKVKTAADVLMYMLAAQIGDCNGCKCTDIGKYTWHWNISAKDVMEMKVGNCGSCANLANYLLDGDYEEVGFIDHTYYPGNGGAHVYTYILYEGKYYIVDYSWYIFEFYDILRDHPVPVLDNLEQWPDYAPSIYGPLNLIMAYDTPGMQYPVLFSENYMADFNNNYYYIVPEGVEYQILFEDPSGYEYYHIPFDKSAYDWTVFW